MTRLQLGIISPSPVVETEHSKAIWNPTAIAQEAMSSFEGMEHISRTTVKGDQSAHKAMVMILPSLFHPGIIHLWTGEILQT